MKRRTLLFGAPILTLIGCTAGSPASAELVNAIDVAETVVTSFKTEAPLLSALLPQILPPATLMLITNPAGSGYLDVALVDVDQLKATIAVQPLTDADGATTLDTVEDYINMALKDVAPVLSVAMPTPGLAEAKAVIQDIILATSLIEAFVNASLPPAAAPTASMRTAAARAAVLPMGGAAKLSAVAAVADLKARMGH